jgi:hypothetical protein
MVDYKHSEMTGAELHDPKNHAGTHTDGTDDIQLATSGQKGLMTAAQFTKVDNFDGSGTYASGTIFKMCLDTNTTLTCHPSAGADFNGDDALQQALDWLGDYDILPGVTVTIQLEDGVYGSGTPLSGIVFSHQNMSSIIIQGDTTDAITFAISAAASAPDTTNDYIYVPAGASSPSDFAPGGAYEQFVVYVVGSTGNDGPYHVVGATTSGADIRLEVDTGAVLDSTKDGTLYLLPSNNCQLVFSGSTNGFTSCVSDTVIIQGIFAHGNITSGSYTCFYMANSGQSIEINHNIMDDWHSGVRAGYNASCRDTGFDYVQANVAFISGYGFYAFINGQISCRHNISGGGIIGYYSADGGVIYADLSVTARNTYGFMSKRGGSYVFCDNAICQNNTTGCVSDDMASLKRTGISLVNNTADYDPAGTPPLQSTTWGAII